MEKSFKSIKVHTDDGSGTSLSFNYIQLNRTWVDCKSLLQDYHEGILVERKHKYLQTQFIMTGAESCRLMVFDEQMQFVSVKIYDNSSNAPFSFLISEPFVLLLPAINPLLDENIKSIEIVVISENGNIFRASSKEDNKGIDRKLYNMNYSHYKMVNKRQFLKTQRPVYYEVFDKDGRMVAGFYHEMYLDKYLGVDGYQITIGDIDKEIRQLDCSIEELEAEIREYKGE